MVDKHPSTYLISSDNLHILEVHRYVFNNGSEGITIHSNHRALHSANGSLGFSRTMAEQLSHALLAVLSGQFDRAVTETYLQVEEATRRRNVEISASRPSPSSPPTLESL